MSHEMGKDLEGSSVDNPSTVPAFAPSDLGKPRKALVRMVGVQDENRPEHLQNSKPELPLRILQEIYRVIINYCRAFRGQYIRKPRQ